MPAATSERVIHRANLCRTQKFTLRAVDDSEQSDDGRTIDGIATMFGADVRPGEEPTAAGGWAFIDSWEGTFWERFTYGAFRKALREVTPRMQFDHGRHPLLGSLPLGVWTSVTEEPDAGLHTIGRLSDNWLIEPFRCAIDDNAVDGMSIRFESVREEWRDAEGKIVKPEDVLQLLWRPDESGPLRRTIKEAKLPEAGPVTWPAYTGTSVGVRSQVVIDLGRLDDPSQRSELARAVFLADAATTRDDGDAPPTTDGPEPSAGEHPAEHDDTPQSTDTPTGEPAGEHESAPTDLAPQDGIDRARAEAADRLFRDALAEVSAGQRITLKENVT